MKPIDQTHAFLTWFEAIGVDRWDVGALRSDDVMLNHYDQSRGDMSRLIPWARAENANGANVYARPHRRTSWPVLFFDDVPPDVARATVARLDALAVRTSQAGGCHLWIRMDAALTEQERGRYQETLRPYFGADPRSTSGEHYGRLPGFKNMKRGGDWVNVLVSSTAGVLFPLAEVIARIPTEEPDEPPAFSQPPQPTIQTPGGGRCGSRPFAASRAAVVTSGVDGSESGREWGYVCGALEHGADPAVIRAGLEERARSRGKRRPEAYAWRTVENALLHVAARRADFVRIGRAGS